MKLPVFEYHIYVENYIENISICIIKIVCVCVCVSKIPLYAKNQPCGYSTFCNPLWTKNIYIYIQPCVLIVRALWSRSLGADHSLTKIAKRSLFVRVWYYVAQLMAATRPFFCQKHTNYKLLFGSQGMSTN